MSGFSLGRTQRRDVEEMMSCPQAAKKSYCGANSNSHFITEPLILSLSIYIKFISYEYYEIFFLQYAYRFDVYKTIALMYLLRILRCIQYVYKYVWISLYAFKVKHTNIPLNHHPNVLSVYMLLHSWTYVNTHTHICKYVMHTSGQCSAKDSYTRTRGIM